MNIYIYIYIVWPRNQKINYNKEVYVADIIRFSNRALYWEDDTWRGFGLHLRFKKENI